MRDILRYQRDAGVPSPVYFIDASRENDAGPRSLLEYAAVVWRRKGTILAIAGVFTLAGFVVSRIQQPVYRSISSVLLEKAAPPLKLDSAPISASDSNVELQIQSEVAVLQSKSLLHRVLSKLNGGRAWTEDPSTDRERELAFAAEHLTITPIKGTRLLKLQGEAHDPALAATLVNTLLDEYTQQEREGSQVHNDASGTWLHKQVDELRNNIEATERKLFAFSSSSGLVSLSETTNAPEERVRQLQQELSKAQVERFAVQSRYELVKGRSAGSSAQPSDSAALREYESKLADLQRQLADVSSLLTPNHYKVRQLEAQISVLAKAAHEEREKALEQVSRDYTSALRREHLLSSEYHKAIGNVATQQNKALHYNLLKRDLQRDRELYDAMIRRTKELGLSNALQASSIRIVDPARPPRQPHRPRTALNTLFAFLTGGVLAIVTILLRENAAQTFTQPGDLSRYLRVNELGAIPAAEESRWARARALIGGNSSETGGVSLTGGRESRRDTVDGGPVDVGNWRRVDSATAQSFRATLASIVFAGESEDQVRTIVVTSPTVGDGKTTIVSNLAFALARMNRKVLLVDADYRKPRLHKIFKCADTADGLGRVLSADHGFARLDAVVRQTTVPNLHILHSGPADAEFPEILSSARAAELLRLARRDFDYVLIDTPPALHLPDARIWGRLADGVVLVVRAGATDRAGSAVALERLMSDGVPILGTVLNAWKARGGQYYGYYSA